MTQCTQSHTLNHRLKRRYIHCNFNGGDVSGNGGMPLLDLAERKLGLIKSMSQVLHDPRDQSRITHSLRALLCQRVFAIAAGYGDLNDHTELRYDAALQSAVGSLSPLASSSTLCRLESHAQRQSIFELHRILLERFIAAHDTPPDSLVLDFDGTDDRVHGEQQARGYNSHYGGYCFFPLYVYCGEHLLVSYLRPGDKSDKHHSVAVLALLVKGIRAHWPEVNIVFRGDAGFYRPLLLSYCERHDVGYIVGFGNNARLKAHYATQIYSLSKRWERTGDAAVQDGVERIRVFHEQAYLARSWKRKRRVISKLEHNDRGGNQRHIVTNLAGEPEQLYSEVYCQRGSMENRHKELQLGLFADRTSCTFWWSNQLRVMFSSMAYVLMHHIRDVGLKGTRLARAQVWTLRDRLIKIGAVVLRNTRRIEFRLSSASTYQREYMQALQRLEAN